MAARAWHTESKQNLADALKAMKEHLPEYPAADLGAAEQQFRHYASDPRNQHAKVLLCEAKVSFALAPPEGDTSPVYIRGTLDQVREENGYLVLCDIKTGGSMEGAEMLDSYAAQLAAYQLGAWQVLGRKVSRACVIRTKDYLKTDRQKRPKPGAVFWYASWSVEDAQRLMDEVRRVVGDIRKGVLRATPSAENCRWCPGGGVANCLGRMVD